MRPLSHTSPSPPPDPRARERRRRIAQVLWWILGLNLVVALAKLYYGYRARALGLTADGVHSLIDGASNAVGLVGISAAGKPADVNHPYGHRKYETVAALVIVMMMFFGCLEIVTGVIERLRTPHMPQIGLAGYVVLGATLLVNLFVVSYESRQARQLQSELLQSDAAHTGSDVLATLLVLGSFVAIRLGFGWADIVAGVAIVILIVRAGIKILQGTLSTLSDERRLDPQEVETAAMAEPGVYEVHNVRSRGPDDDIHLDLHVLVSASTPLAEAHALGHRVESRLRQRWPGVSDVVVHVEPALESERARERVGGGLRAEG
jgi:cation diffusion facilitator family transporter